MGLLLSERNAVSWIFDTVEVALHWFEALAHFWIEFVELGLHRLDLTDIIYATCVVLTTLGSVEAV